ncbi:MAG: DUF2971 domain-containing protein [Clostridium sp.]|uniref:DUF2971 domain-containing protein n=1 Tax=Clostridium sp. TaxID=1506 RepID=UPI00290E33CB|nr:DUF2971 domain-containing protein [Clostridium sp.]MDU7337823.1 DUF2971 domain-containing protein [Clostridium sp.]
MPNSDNSWVKSYIHKLFTCNLNKEGTQLRAEKIEHANIPLYKYCYVCDEAGRTSTTIDYNIDNFENNILFFQNPSKFNDPFDCFLGFSQSELIRDLLFQELKKKKQLTPQNRKAIKLLFGNSTDEFSTDSITSENLGSLTKLITGLIPDEDPLASVYAELLHSLSDESPNMLKKLVANSLTIHDKQVIVDLLYNNPTFCEIITKNCDPKNVDFILKVAPRDMKLKIETEPDSFMSSRDGNVFGIFDFLRYTYQLSGDANDFSIKELNDIKEKFNQLSNEAMVKSRKLIDEQFRITCLSERMDSSLMWSHYANKHYGFCLEYDFTATLIERRYPDLLPTQLMLFPVIYTENRPLLSKVMFSGKAMMQMIKTKKLPPDFLEKLMLGLLCKSQDWSYEKEWRVFQLLSEAPTMRLPKAQLKNGLFLLLKKNIFQFSKCFCTATNINLITIRLHRDKILKAMEHALMLYEIGQASHYVYYEKEILNQLYSRRQCCAPSA